MYFSKKKKKIDFFDLSHLNVLDHLEIVKRKIVKFPRPVEWRWMLFLGAEAGRTFTGREIGSLESFRFSVSLWSMPRQWTWTWEAFWTSKRQYCRYFMAIPHNDDDDDDDNVAIEILCTVTFTHSPWIAVKRQLKRGNQKRSIEEIISI